MTNAAGWKLEGFLERLELWEKNEPVSAVDGHRRLIVALWIMDRAADPYAGVERGEGFDNYWFGPIPGTEHDGQIVCCSYWVEESSRTVRCDLFSTLSLPI